MSWSVSGVSLADLGVDSLGIRLRNQDDDFAELRFPSNFDAELPSWLQPDSYVDIRYGGAVAFRGHVDGKTVFASPSMEYKSLFVFGPWHTLRQRMFLYSYPYVSGNDATTHGFIGGSVNSIVYSILSQATDILSIGTIDLGDISIPTIEIVDMTLAQALQAVLRYIPGALVLFDYSTSRPTCSVLSDNSASLQTRYINVADGTCVSFQATPHYERYLNGVQLFYEASRSIKSGEFDVRQDGYGQTINSALSPIGVSGFYIVGTDVAGNLSGRRILRKTIRLSGAYDQTTYSIRGQLFNRTLYQATHGTSTGVSGNLVDFTVWSCFFRVFAAKSMLKTSTSDFHNYIESPSLKGSVSASTTSNGSFKPLIASGAEFSSFTTSSITSLEKSPAIQLNSIPSVFLESPGLSVQLATLVWDGYYQLQYPVGPLTLTAADVLFVDPSNFSNGVFTKTVSSNNVEMPSGIAAKIFAANSRLLHDGKITIAQDSALYFTGNFRRISISPLGIETPVQSVDIDSSTDLVELSFGAPTQLGPQDLITLLRAGTA